MRFAERVVLALEVDFVADQVGIDLVHLPDDVDPRAFVESRELRRVLAGNAMEQACHLGSGSCGHGLLGKQQAFGESDPIDHEHAERATEAANQHANPAVQPRKVARRKSKRYGDRD